jgi:AraC-like DNA-binding protein
MLNMSGVSQRGTRGPEETVAGQIPVLSPLRSVLMLSPFRWVYTGPNGNATQRAWGSLVVYVSLDTCFRIRIGGGAWERALIAVVHPFVPHQIVPADRLIANVALEPESIDQDRLPEFLARSGILECHELLTRAREAFEHLRHAGRELLQHTHNLDTLFFGQPIERRDVDARISMILERIRQRPCDHLDAETCAALTGISVSRFLHLFKQETGVTFRCFRAWKRARHVLVHLKGTKNLSDFALETGYPDATHFCHSIRSAYGLSPREILAIEKHLVIQVL